MKHIKIEIPDEGFDIYTPRVTQSWGYRYGPSIMVDRESGICEAWFASPGAQGEADWFTYRKSTDGGVNWSPEIVVLMPTPDSMDWFSVCDPAVIKYGGYYYIGYTSTVFSDGGGVCNNAFVARSKNAEGPYEKWTGDGWGEKRGGLSWTGKPAPIIYYDEPWQNWGAGEPSFVIKDDVLYMYYTWTSKQLDGSFVSMTRVATADITDENWPANLTLHGTAAIRSSGAHDSFDVVYCEDLDKFVAISTDKRFSDESMLAIYESDDGLEFRRVNELRVNTGCRCHNSGISGDAHHHIRSGDLMLLGYAYGNQWGCWGTRFHKYSFSGMDEDFYSEADLPNVPRDVVKSPLPDKLWPIALTSVPHFYRAHIGEEIKFNLFWLDTCYTENRLTDGVEFSNYDKNIIEISEDGTAYAKNVGYTYVDAHYAGVRLQFLIYVYPEDFDFSGENKTVVSFELLTDEYEIDFDEKEQKQIRGLAVYSDGTWLEASGAEKGVTYHTDSALITIDENGIIIPSGDKGEAEVTVECGGLSFAVKVTVY